MRRPLSFSLFFFSLSRSLHAGSGLWAKFKTCMLLTHTLGRTTPPHTLTRSVTHMLKQLTYVIIAQTRKFSPAAQLSRAQRSPMAATERQSSSNCSQMYAMFFSIFLAALTLRSAATLPRCDALLPPNGRSFSKYLCCRQSRQNS